MRFMWPQGGTMARMSHLFGAFTSPGHGGIVAGIKEHRKFSVDNEAFTKGWNPDRFFPFLDMLRPYQRNCLFVVVPDVVGEAEITLDMWHKWHKHPRYEGWPLAYVAQNGQEDLTIPEDCQAVFIGGDTEWKESEHALSVATQAVAMSKRVHFGRVNWGRRYFKIRAIPGSDKFTCDGTRHKHEDSLETEMAWLGYMTTKNYQLRMF